MERHFSKPTDVGSNFSTAVAARDSSGRFVKLCIGKWWPLTTIAPAFEKLAMHMDDVPGTRILVQPIYILGAKKEPVAKRFFKVRQSKVPGIRAGACRGATAHGVILPDELRVATPSLRRRNLLETIFPPQSPGIPVCGDTALGADASSGEDKNSVDWTDF